MITTQEIIDALNTVPDQVKDWDSLGSWSDTVKNAIGKLAEKHELGVCATTSEKQFMPEWLYDLTAYSNRSGYLEKVELVMESEWIKASEELKFDFEKLLQAKARIKLFVFETKPNQLNDVLSELKKGIGMYPYGFPGETYILAVWSVAKQAFHIEIIEI